MVIMIKSKFCEVKSANDQLHATLRLALQLASHCLVPSSLKLNQPSVA